MRLFRRSANVRKPIVVSTILSVGERLDTLSILELQLADTSNSDNHVELQRKISDLQSFIPYKQQYSFYYKLLLYVNKQLMDLTDKIKSITADNSDFSTVLQHMVDYDTKRFRITNWINSTISSDTTASPNYIKTYCTINIKTEDEIYAKIPEINYLLLEYDIVLFECSFISTIKKLFKNPTILYDQLPDNATCNETIILTDFTIPSDEDRNIFEFNPLTYLAGGLLGDFIHTLSVVCEKFYDTGRKGTVYISNQGDPFRHGLEQTYNDTYKIVMNQKYMHSYKIFNGEPYDINLVSWRHIPDLNTNDWHYIFSKMYEVDWGKHKWLDVEYNSKWSNKVLINTTNYRWPYLDFQLLYEKYKDDLVFISADINQYRFFCEKTQLTVEYCNITDFSELCSAISSCKLFVGNLSAPLSIAHSVNVNRICALFGGWDDPLNINLDKIWNNIYYSV